MADMDQVKASVNQDDSLSLVFELLDDSGSLGKRVDFSQFLDTIVSLSSWGVTVAVPFFMTTTPPAKLARRDAS